MLYLKNEKTVFLFKRLQEYITNTYDSSVCHLQQYVCVWNWPLECGVRMKYEVVDF